MASKGPRKVLWDYYSARDLAGPRGQSYPVTKNDAVANDGDGYMSNDELSQFEPPLLGILATGSGNVNVCLHGDDETDASKRSVIALTAGVPETRFAIRKIFATSTTATGIMGYR